MGFYNINFDNRVNNIFEKSSDYYACIMRVNDGRILYEYNPGLGLILTPVGSTIKPFTACAYSKYFDTTDHKVVCSGRYYMDGGYRPYGCTHIHGLINMQESLPRSCNYMFYELAEIIGADNLKTFYENIGFNKVEGLFLDSIKTKEDLVFLGIGQDNIKIFPRVLGLLYSALFNGGVLNTNPVSVLSDKNNFSYIRFPLSFTHQIGTLSRSNIVPVSQFYSKTGSVRYNEGIHGWAVALFDDKSDFICLTIYKRKGLMGASSCGPKVKMIYDLIIKG